MSSHGDMTKFKRKIVEHDSEIGDMVDVMTEYLHKPDTLLDFVDGMHDIDIKRNQIKTLAYIDRRKMLPFESHEYTNSEIHLIKQLSITATLKFKSNYEYDNISSDNGNYKVDILFDFIHEPNEKYYLLVRMDVNDDWWEYEDSKNTYADTLLLVAILVERLYDPMGFKLDNNSEIVKLLDQLVFEENDTKLINEYEFTFMGHGDKTMKNNINAIRRYITRNSSR